MYHPHYVIRSIEQNIKNTGNPLGLSRSQINTWWEGWEGWKKVGEKDTMLFTGLLYQLTPYVDKLVDYLYKFENTFLEKVTRFMPKSPLGILLKPQKEAEHFNGIVRKIADSLIKSGIDFCYKPELDFYSGVLLYDMGDDEGFTEHSLFVAEKLREKGIKKLITIDPHTTYVLRELYPEYANAEFEVKNYLEILDFKSKKENENITLTLHDPCYYGRYLEISDESRRILDSLGIEYKDIRNSGKLTSCCGGPIESISPKLTKEVAENRYDELSKTGCEIATMCPICLVNLRKFGEIKDISEIIWGAVNA
jgi:Fe-S oxidoreductase